VHVLAEDGLVLEEEAGRREEAEAVPDDGPWGSTEEAEWRVEVLAHLNHGHEKDLMEWAGEDRLASSARAHAE
jgi:hypothetical protein